MALTRQRKEELAADYAEALGQVPHAFVVDYRGISVPEATELRDRIRASGGQYIVVKNRIARRALAGGTTEGLIEHLQGPTAVAYSHEDPVALAKALSDFASDVPALEFKAAMVEGREIGPEEITTLAKLPSREELLTKLVFLMQSPVTRFVRTINAIPQQFVNVLHQIAGQKG